MASINKFIGIGNLTKDPETRFMPNGDAVTSASIACNETWKDKNGQKQERVEYVNLVFFRKLAEIVAEYCKKGNPIYVEGRLQTDKYTDKAGVEKYATKVVCETMKMLGGKPSGATQQGKPTGGGASGFDDMDSDIPF